MIDGEVCVRPRLVGGRRVRKTRPSKRCRSACGCGLRGGTSRVTCSRVRSSQSKVTYAQPLRTPYVATWTELSQNKVRKNDGRSGTPLRGQTACGLAPAKPNANGTRVGLPGRLSALAPFHARLPAAAPTPRRRGRGISGNACPDANNPARSMDAPCPASREATQKGSRLTHAITPLLPAAASAFVASAPSRITSCVAFTPLA